MIKTLSRTQCLQITGGTLEVPTTTTTEISKIHCECRCVDPARERFIDASDDPWIWWIATRPYYAVKSVFTFFWH